MTIGQAQPQIHRNYKIPPNDLLHIQVFQEKDLEAKTRVSQDGKVVLHLLGAIKVGSLTVDEASLQIKNLLAKDYLVDPQVTVTILEYAKRRFTVLGEVEKPGSYEIPQEEQVNLLQAIAMAGGFTKAANKSQIELNRKIAGREKTYRLSTQDTSSASDAARFFIRPDDVISIKYEQRMFAVLGEVQKPGYLKIPEEEPIDLLKAIAMAGGYTRIANPSKVIVRRNISGKETVYTINANKMAKDSTMKVMMIKPGDVVTVSESIF